MVKISIQVHAGAKKNEIVRFQDGVWHLKIAAPPVEGKANKKLIEFLSEVLGVSKNRITIEKGTTSRRKMMVVEGMTETEVTKRLQKILTNL
jgi:uncharacterized protein (TIGR00251 family)